jgi:AbiV family abortive infection protein
MSDKDSVDAMDLSRELRDHKPKLSAGQSVTPVPMSPLELKEWEAACLAGNDAAASAISDRVRSLAVKLKPHQVSELHARRMRAQYVDIDINTGTWITPSSIAIEEADTLLRTIHAELANTLIAAPRLLWLRDAQTNCGVTLPTIGDFSHRFYAAASARDA